MFFGKPFLIVILFVVCSVDVSGQQAIFTVSGEISFPGTGDLYVQLITKEEFDSDRDAGFGIIVAVGPEDVKKGRALFAFTGVPGGRYGIRCFQDVSGTGKMEKGMFGPKEPWGTYRPARPAFRAPRFDEISFEVNKDIGEIKIELK
ncbi:MAG TPA: DUF2141 domain-containing protein [Syntrophorhabdaceae bacterium]|nr:DUF2141 domain-containing protein [Syntrophorhabdaceae bacterium]HQM81465.1 DUF2141 domain-containing protein [Syntrophorhabdaceae bacterium]